MYDQLVLMELLRQKAYKALEEMIESHQRYVAKEGHNTGYAEKTKDRLTALAEFLDNYEDALRLVQQANEGEYSRGYRAAMRDVERRKQMEERKNNLTLQYYKWRDHF